MNKKSLFGLFAMGTLLFTASCQEEDVVKQAQENTLATVSINVTTPEMGVATRAFGDGTTAKRLHYAVYNVKGEGDQRTRTYLPDLTVDGEHEINLSTTVDLQLVTGNTYDVIFWADADVNDEIYKLDWKNDEDPTVSIKYENDDETSNVTANKEAYDAFFGKITIVVDGSKTTSVTLKRPFAQLNIGTSDIDEAASAGYVVEKSQVLVESYSTLHLWEKGKSIEYPEAVSNPVTVDFSKALIPARYNASTTPATGERFPLKEKKADGTYDYVEGYDYLAMNYLLRPADKDLVEVKFNFFSNSGEEKNRTYSSIPVRRNWRTNVYGQLITSDVDVNVTIDPYFEDENPDDDEKYDILVWDGHSLTQPQAFDHDLDGDYDEVHVYDGSELAYIANKINGGGQSNAQHAPATRDGEGEKYDANVVIKLKNDIDLGGENWTPIKQFLGTFDGLNEERDENFVISNLKVRTEGKASAGLFAAARNVKNLTIKNAEVYGHYKTGVIAGDGLCGKFENCQVENAKILVTPFEQNDANNVGGIVGYLSAEPTAYVKGCTVKNAEIVAYRKVGGIVGAATGSGGKAEISGNTVENVTVVADFTMEYNEVGKLADVGAIVGWANPDASVVSGNNEVAPVFAGNKLADGVYIVNGEYEIHNVAGLKWLAEQVNGGNTFKTKTVKLANNLELNSEEWTPIGNSTNKFQGTFDGQNHVVKNLVINGGSKSNQGLFGMTTDGEIKNLVVENAKVSGRLNVGVVAGTPYTSKYTNITLKGHVEVNGMSYVGGVGGKNAYANWENITVNVDETSYVKANSVENGTAYRTYVGGVCGFNGEGGHTFKNITSNIDVTGSTCDVGGLFGIAHYGNKFESCSSSGDVEITGASEAADAEEMGGIAGVWNNGGADVVFTNCSFTGTLKANIEEGVDLTDNTIVGKAYSAGGTGKLIIDGMVFIAVSTQEQLDAALNDANIKTIYLAEGDFGTIVAKSNKTIVGSGNAKVDCVNLNGAANLTLKNIKFDAAKAGEAYDGKGNMKQNANIFSGGANKNGKGSRGLVIENCEFTGTFANGGTAIAFTDQGRGSGQSGDITITGCTFANKNAYYDIYCHYSGFGEFNIVNNTFSSETAALPIYLGRYQSSTPVVVKGNAFEKVATFADAAYIQAHSNQYTVSFNASENTFGE